jgi:hypothetical protein
LEELATGPGVGQTRDPIPTRLRLTAGARNGDRVVSLRRTSEAPVGAEETPMRPFLRAVVVSTIAAASGEIIGLGSAPSK